MRFLAQLPQGLDVDSLILDVGCCCAKGKPGECLIEEGCLKHNDFGEVEEVLNRQHFQHFFEVIVCVAVGQRVDIYDSEGILWSL